MVAFGLSSLTGSIFIWIFPSFQAILPPHFYGGW